MSHVFTAGYAIYWHPQKFTPMTFFDTKLYDPIWKIRRLERRYKRNNAGGLLLIRLNKSYAAVLVNTIYIFRRYINVYLSW